MKKIVLFSFIALSFWCCDRKTSNTLTAVPLEETNKDFREFFERFHTDSIYQLQHLTDPVTGIPAMVQDESLLDGSYIWPRDEWAMHKPFNNIENEYARTYLVANKNLITETIRHKVSNFAMERRFVKENGEWYLTYYAGMNMLN